MLRQIEGSRAVADTVACSAPRQNGKSVILIARALAGALSWLRSEATVAVIRDWIEDRLQATGADEQLEQTHAELAFENDDDLFFAAEYYWAPFHVTGRAVRATP